eukprot:3175183-Prorocentrum_lima.AAC.1
MVDEDNKPGNMDGLVRAHRTATFTMSDQSTWAIQGDWLMGGPILLHREAWRAGRPKVRASR